MVVSAPEVIVEQRYPLFCVVPITGTPGEGALYPRLKPGASGLSKPSFALIDQLRSVDKSRVTRFLARSLEMSSGPLTKDSGCIWGCSS